MAIITKSKLIEYIRYGLISQTWFDKLPKEKQELLRDVRKEYEMYYEKIHHDTDDGYLWNREIEELQKVAEVFVNKCGIQSRYQKVDKVMI